MNIEAKFVGKTRTHHWAGIINPSNEIGWIWRCKHKHRFRHTALACAYNQRVMGEKILRRLWK